MWLMNRSPIHIVTIEFSVDIIYPFFKVGPKCCLWFHALSALDLTPLLNLFDFENKLGSLANGLGIV